MSRVIGIIGILRDILIPAVVSVDIEHPISGEFVWLI
jgi:hypothetical protein